MWHAREGLSGPSQGQGLWGEYSRADVVETTIEGSHYEMMAEPYVSESSATKSPIDCGRCSNRSPIGSPFGGERAGLTRTEGPRSG